jgi:preprotein translocase subunit YajC
MRSKTKTHALAVMMVMAFIILTASPALAAPQRRAAKKPHVRVDKIAPRAEDVSTLGGIIAAFYEVISGPAGSTRQWSRDRTLYIPDIKFVAVEERKGKPFARIVSHQEYVDESNDGMVRGGFFEREIHRVTQAFGNITHVFSTYESRQTAAGPVIARGINSIELYFDGARWWITAAQWQDESKQQPILKEFLP